MTDHELLKMAAKAAGIEIVGWNRDFPMVSDPLRTCIYWSPLTSDGDALRLAVKLDLAVGVYHQGVRVGEPDKHGGHKPIAWIPAPAHVARHDWDDCAATRRAIVRAAAEIGGRP